MANPKMRDIFIFIDSWQSKINIFRDSTYIRKVALTFALSMIPVWLLLGFDSGVGMLEEGVKALVSGQNVVEKAYSVYGMTFHFSSYVIYGLLFVALSKHFESLGVKGSKNIAYSAILSLFNIGVFEMWYMTTFAVFQMNRHFIGWFVEDFWRGPPATHFSLVVLGLMVLLFFWADSFKLKEGQITGRNYRFHLNKEMCIAIALCVFGMLLWVYYPLPVESITIGDWTSSSFFPQTHYAYMQSARHVANDMLHFVNVTVKALFALTQFVFLSGFQRET